MIAKVEGPIIYRPTSIEMRLYSSGVSLQDPRISTSHLQGDLFVHREVKFGNVQVSYSRFMNKNISQKRDFMSLDDFITHLNNPGSFSQSVGFDVVSNNPHGVILYFDGKGSITSAEVDFYNEDLSVAIGIAKYLGLRIGTFKQKKGEVNHDEIKKTIKKSLVTREKNNGTIIEDLAHYFLLKNYYETPKPATTAVQQA